MNKLRIAKELSLPLDAVTQKLAWLGRTGSGKTFGCKRMVEQMLRAEAQVVILDGSGGWAGLRLGPKAFKIPVLGGLYGDIPLEPTAGALVADVIVDRGTSMVLDVSQMLDAERTRFATAFAQRFFQRKKAAPDAVHLVLEECQDFVPENCQRGEEQMLHEFQRLAKQGRPHGIGISFISQRPQEISKKALNQAECVFAFQMNGPHERKALQYWLSDKGFEGKLADVLPTLEVGAPYVWSPQWLKVSKIVSILPIESLDTSSTPKVGKKRATREKLKPIDLKGLSTAMAETIERAKENDPKLMRAEIAKLKTELAKNLGIATLVADREQRAKSPKLQPFEVVVDRRHLEETISASDAMEKAAQTFDEEFTKLRASMNVAARVLRRARATGPSALSKQLAKAGPAPKNEPPPPVRPSVAHRSPKTNGSYNGARDSSIGNSGLCRMLVALAQRPEGLSRRALGLRAGLSSKTGTFGTYLSRARTAGWIDGKSDFRITEAGLAALGSYTPLPEGAELFDHWLREIGTDSGAGRMLRALSEAFPATLSREELASSSNLSASTGTFGTYLSRLRGLELIEGKGELRLSEELVG